MLADLHPSIALADFIGKLKANASRWWNVEHPRARIAWQRGYGSFSVSQSKVNDVIAYIHGQEVHHRKKNFQDELRDLLRLHKIAYDENGISAIPTDASRCRRLTRPRAIAPDIRLKDARLYALVHNGVNGELSRLTLCTGYTERNDAPEARTLPSFVGR